jgi:hypothetical protein
MKPHELSKAVARVADTPGTTITAAEVNRVLACTWDVFFRLELDEAIRLFADCYENARARQQDAAVSD